MKPLFARGTVWLSLGLIAALSLPAVAEDDLSARKRTAGLPSTTQAVLLELAHDPAWEVREVLGRNRRASAELLRQLAQDPDARVRIAVATNLSTPEDVHRLLADDVNPQVRSVVARFEYVPIPVLMHLADDPMVDVRLEVARSLNANEAVLRKALKDTDPSVSHTAEQALKALLEQ